MTGSATGLIRLARGLLLLLVAAVLIVLTVDALDTGAGRGEHSVAMVAGVIATIALAQLAAVLLGRHRLIWRRVRPLWHQSNKVDDHPPPPAVVELDALIISASTGGPRARERLDRRLTALGCSTLGDHLTTADPNPQQVVSAVARIIEHHDRQHGDDVDQVSDRRVNVPDPTERTESSHVS